MTSTLTSGTSFTREQARRSWPRRAAAGVGLLAVAVVALALPGIGGRLMLGVLGLGLLAQGALLARSDEPARPFGIGEGAVGVAAVAIAAASAPLAGRVLLVGVPVVLLLASAGLIGRSGVARRGGQVLLVWSVLVVGVLVATGFGRGWDRATEVATVVAAIVAAVAAVPLLVGAAGLRALAHRPAPSPAYPAAGCGGCACGAGGCGATNG